VIALMSRWALRLLGAFVAAVAISAGAVPQGPPPPPANPQTARDWRQVGAARQRARDYDGALAAYRRSLELEPDSPVAMYNVGAVYALKHDADQAFEWLRRAKQTHRLDMTQLEID